MIRVLIGICLALVALTYWLWVGLDRWRDEAFHQEQRAQSWQEAAELSVQRYEQAQDSLRIANEEAERQREAVAEYDAIRRAFIEGDDNDPLPDDFADALRRLLTGARGDSADPDRSAGSEPGVVAGSDGAGEGD